MSDIDTEVEEGGPTTWPRQDHEDRLKRCEAELAGRSRLGRMPGDLLPTLAHAPRCFVPRGPGNPVRRRSRPIE
jgi:hypothetical protein